MIANEDLEALIRMFEQSHWRELELRIAGSDIFLSKDESARASWREKAGAVASAAAPVPVALPGATSAPSDGPATAAKPAGDGFSVPEGCTVVAAPSLGTFYRAPKPGSPPFAEVGQAISEDTELCLIEVMKLFTTLRAGTAGTIVDILAKDGDLVEYEQPLFVIRTHG